MNIFIHFSIMFLVFHSSNFKSSSYIKDINLLSVIYAAIFFSQFVSCHCLFFPNDVVNFYGVKLINLLKTASEFLDMVRKLFPTLY